MKYGLAGCNEWRESAALGVLDTLLVYCEIHDWQNRRYNFTGVFQLPRH